MKLNNPLRTALHFFRTFKRNLLKSGYIDVSYFAAGIISHLVTGGGTSWEIQAVARQDLLDDLVKSASQITAFKLKFSSTFQFIVLKYGSVCLNSILIFRSEKSSIGLGAASG